LKAKEMRATKHSLLKAAAVAFSLCMAAAPAEARISKAAKKARAAKAAVARHEKAVLSIKKCALQEGWSVVVPGRPDTVILNDKRARALVRGGGDVMYVSEPTPVPEKGACRDVLAAGYRRVKRITRVVTPSGKMNI
jgi:hypothetical protein